jgi:diaminopimelate epimerase
VRTTPVPFTKYTSFGNNFLIVDETVTPLPGEGERATLARWLLNDDFGLGGTDNVLYLTRLHDGTGAGAEFEFRIFEHDGTETLSCGNGLLCTAAFLNTRYDLRQAIVLTEVPTGEPRPVRLGTGEREGTTWVNVGEPRPAPAQLFNRAGPPPSSRIDHVTGIAVPLPAEAARAGGLPPVLTLSGYLTFTGEPHLALISGQGLPEELEKVLFVEPGGQAGPELIGRPPTPEVRATLALVDHLGRRVNEAYRHLFPQGVHLNFARFSNGAVEYRTYERAIDRETLACGSGVIAMAFVLQELGLAGDERTRFWPHRCRWFVPEAELVVTSGADGWSLTGMPLLVARGDALVPGSVLR